MSRGSIFNYLQDVPPAIAIEVVYLVGHQLAHPKFSLLEAEIPNSALDGIQKSKAKAIASDIISSYVESNGKLVSEFNDHEKMHINNKIRGFIRENIIDNSDSAKQKADQFLEDMAA